MAPTTARRSGREIAIIGISCRFPGAANRGKFWANLRDGVESITFFTDEDLASSGVPRRVLEDPDYVRAQGVLDDADSFDAAFFGISPKEADFMDPQHRLLLECAWEALEDGGYDPQHVPGVVGVFAGGYRNDYLAQVACGDDPAAIFLRNIGNECDYFASRIAYKLNLTGPTLTVQTACSTSLVAVHLGCQTLLSGECDLALAGGATVRAGQIPGYIFRKGGILSSDGHCRAFDADGEGTVIGDGVGLVALKRLGDALAHGDTIRAVIKGSATGNDGADRVGFTAPGVHGQARLIQAALESAGIESDTVTYVETHGSGTPLGDRIELTALTHAFEACGWRRGSCAIGSVKTNIGHIHAAAGIAGVIKTVLALEHRMLPPSLHFTRPNPQIDFAGSPFHVNTEPVDWESNGVPRRAGVSSFGIGGTGAHVVLEEAPPQEPRARSPRSWHVLTLSARSERALETATDRLAQHLEETPDVDFADVAYTLHVGRHGFTHRRALVAHDLQAAAAALRARDPTKVFSNAPQGSPPIAFMFPGLGDHHVQMGRQLYESERAFRQAVDRCNELLKARSGVDLLPLLYPALDEPDLPVGARVTSHPSEGLDLRRMLKRERPEASALNRTEHVQPAVFVVEYALAQLWMAWGVRPDALIGYSIGEYVAACLAGVLTLDDALFLVAERARLIADLPRGSMLAVPLPEERVRGLLDASASLAAVNGPALCVVAGPEDAIVRIEERLTLDSMPTRRLQTSHAFHSRMMEPIAPALIELMSSLTLSDPTQPYLSNVTGTWITAAEATDPSYWARHLCEPVRFADGVGKLWSAPNRILLEVGPGHSLGSFALSAGHSRAGDQSLVLASLPQSYDRQSECRFLFDTLGKLWLAGVPVVWESFHADERRFRIPLPTYPFERQRHGADSQRCEDEQAPNRSSANKKPDMADWFHIPSWKALPPLVRGSGELADPSIRWLVFTDDCGVGRRITRRLAEIGHQVATVAIGERRRELAPGQHTIDPGRLDDYVALLQDFRRLGGLPQKIVHLWTVTSDECAPQRPGWYEEIQRRGFYSLLLLAQALGRENLTESIEVSVVSSDMHAVHHTATSYPEKATVLGPCTVLPQENPYVTCRSIDISLPPVGTWAERRATEMLLAEVTHPIEETVLAHRSLSRWNRTFVPVRTEAPRVGASRLRERGVYLITGGLGGMGLVLCRHLARTVQAKLVLTSRSSLPPRSDWKRWAVTHGDDATARRIRQIEELEAAGSEVLVQRADVANLNEMQSVVAEACQRFGGIDGVIHAAGVPGTGLIQLKDLDAAARVLAPKVQGALVLEAVCRPLDVDFILLCSSLLAVSGALGQVDYCAANAFMDAFAHRTVASGSPFMASVNWDAWQEVGMAFENVGQGRDRPITSRKVQHPLLDACLLDTPLRAIYASTFDVKTTWLIDEHRMLGNAVVPGTGHLEMVRAAVAHHEGTDAMEMQDVTFFTPIVVRDDETKEVRVLLEKDGDDGYEFSVISRDGGDGDQGLRWQLHSTGKVGHLRSPSRRQHDVAGMIERRGLRDIGRPVHDGPMGLDGRSRCLEKVYVGDDEFLALIELPAQFADDLDQLELHPSIMDVAAAFVGMYLAKDFRIPISYKRIEVKAPLSRRVYSHQRYQDAERAGKETVSADITIMDERGRELVCVEEFVLKRAGDLETRLTTVRNGTSTETVPYDYADPTTGDRVASVDDGFLRERLEHGILPSEGVAVFERILSTELSPQVLVSPTDLRATVNRMKRAWTAPVTDGDTSKTRSATYPRPNLLTNYVEPRNEVERDLAALWQELLGLERIGIHDHFFDLGGHSLLGLQLVSRLREVFAVDVPPGVLFEALTVAELAEVLAARKREEADVLVSNR